MLMHTKRPTALWFVTIMLLLGAYDFSLATVNEPQDAYLEVKFRSKPTLGVRFSSGLTISVRPGGIACKVKAWSSDRDVTKPPDLDLVLSEFPEPTGEATYFLVSDATVAVDDELIFRD